MIARLPLALRLALRRLRTQKLATALSAIALAIPSAALIVVYVGMLNGGGDAAGAGVTVAVVSPLVIALGTIAGSMVASAALVRSRGHERMLVLLETIGASRGLRFRVASASGILTGLIASVIAAALGVAISLVYVAVVLRPENAVVVPPGAVALSALVSVPVAWLSSVVLLLEPRNRPLVAELRDLPKPMGAPLTSGLAGGRIGRVFLVTGVGLGMVASGFQLARLSLDLSSDWSIVIGLGLMCAVPAGLFIAGGAILLAPAFFAAVGRRFGQRNTAVQLATRDAVLSPVRAVAAVAAIIFIALPLTSYSTFFRANAAIDVQTYDWSFQLGQVAVDTIDPGWTEGGPMDPGPVERIAEGKAALDDYLGVESRQLDAVKGPFYGQPIDDYEGMPGREEMVFPTEGGLPTPRIASDGPCAAEDPDETLAPWRCLPEPYGFELSSVDRDIWVGDEADLAAILDHQPEASLVDALDRGEALLFDARYLGADNTATLDWYGPDQYIPENQPGEFLPVGTPLRSATLTATLIPLEHRLDYGLFLSAETAEQLGLTAEPSRLIASPGRVLTQEEFTELDAVMTAATTDADGMGGVYPWPEFGPNNIDLAWPVGAILLAFGGTLAIAFTAVGLVRFEGRGSTRTLRSLGAAPDIGARVTAWYAVLVIGYASVVGTGVAILLTAALWRPGVNPFWPGPLLEFGVLGLGVPLIAALVARLIRRPSEGTRA